MIIIQDNLYIFDFKGENDMKIPRICMDDLEKILKNMKNGKACDIYKVTNEHLKYSGDEAKTVILNLLNDIITNISYLSCPQVKTGLGTAACKGKKETTVKGKFVQTNYGNSPDRIHSGSFH